MPPSEAPRKAHSTSAEPSSSDPWAELFTCRHAVLADRVPDLYGHDAPRLESVLRAARPVEAAVQERLLAAGGVGSTLDLRYARGLWDAQWQAHTAVVAKTASRKKAKTLQQSAARGRPPLTVCVGRRQRRFKPNHETVMRFNAPDMFTDEHPDYVPYVPLGYGDGCGLIIVDTSAVRPSPPRMYCDRCAAKAGNTMNAGLAKNALAQLRAGRKLG